jgi:ribosomal protein S18 acetylase RimI-like enzyme
MNKVELILYKSVSKNEIEGIKKMIIEDFNFKRFSNKDRLLNCIADYYLRIVLLQSTYSLVAVKNNLPIGIIFGRSDKEIFLPDRLINKFILVIDFLKILILSIFNLKPILEALKIDKAYKKLTYECNKTFMGEITTLIVSKQFQGFGIGKKLYLEFYNYMINTGVRSFFLYTDDSLSYGFYDKQDMQRIGTTKITLDIKPMPQNLEVYLYSKDVIPL